MSNAYLFHVDARAVADEGDELSIQVRFRARMKMLAPRVRIIAIPNAGKRTAWAAMKAKNEGLAKGFPDTEALWAGGHAYLEFKDAIRPLESEQIDWLNWLYQAGFPCGCFRSVDTAVEFCRAAGAPFMDTQAAA